MGLAMRDTEAGVRKYGRLVNNLRFADDIDLLADTQKELQELTDRVNDSSKRLGLRINREKTKTMAIGKQHRELEVKLEDRALEQVTEFVYLGGMMTEDGSCTKDIKRRIGLSCAMYGRLSKMWKSRNLSVHTKMKLYGALVVPVLRYGAECWCLRKEDERRLLVAEMSWLRGIIGRSRRDRIRNETIRKKLGAEETVVDKIKKRRLTWFGHVSRMDDKRLPAAALHGQVEGTRSRGRQKKTWLDNIKEDLEEEGLDMRNAMNIIRDREKWRRHVKASSSAKA